MKSVIPNVVCYNQKKLKKTLNSNDDDDDEKIT